MFVILKEEYMDLLKELQYVLDFTDVYRSEEDIYLREAACLKLQTPNMLAPLSEDDRIAGRMQHRYVGFSPQYGGLYTYFFHEDKVETAIKECERELTPGLRERLTKTVEFWGQEKTLNRLNRRFEEAGFQIPCSHEQPGIGNADGRIAGMNVDLDKLIRLGLPGLRTEIETKRREQPEKEHFYSALLSTVDTIADACDYYRVQADAMLAVTGNRDFRKLSQVLASIQTKRPQSFYEALQLFWIYAMISDLMNYGRMDVYLGDLYMQDIESGVVDEEEAIDLILSMYRHMLKVHKIHDTRVIIGGRGRRNTANADALAMTIMEASRRFREVVPQLTMRYYSGMDERLYDKALQVNAEGCTFPIIYSDDTNVPAVMKVYGVPEEEAERYLPFGCGEYVLEGLSVGTPNNGINLLKALEVTLRNGYDGYWDQQIGERTGAPEAYVTFEALWSAYSRQVEAVVYRAALHKRLNFDVAAQQSGYLHISLLMDDCIARGEGLLNGGVRYLNASSEIFGLISAADSFTAIKKLVYDEKKYTLRELVDILDGDFDGREDVRQECLKAPKYGNDDTAADEMAVRVFDHIAKMTIRTGELVGLQKYNIVSVNNSMSAEWGTSCLASACGRHKSAPMSNGNGPSIGADQNGITALLNSMSKFNPATHVGVINNVRFTKEMFKNSYGKVKAALRVFYENGGVQTNICAVGKDDMENAIKTPEKYRNLIVRIGGFSARFVELNPVIQNELILRTTYDA